jgi:uncharacterized repeat protein (TIGR01451 family)
MGIIRRNFVTCALFCVCATTSGQATLHTIDVKAIAEVEAKRTEDGRIVTGLVPADRLVPGDSVVYTLEIRNYGREDISAPTIVRAVPEHTIYVGDSATGPGAEVNYSVDGGVSFDRPENLRITDADHRSRRALPSDYTHIRWTLRIVLKSKSVAYARFRAIVK